MQFPSRLCIAALALTTAFACKSKTTSEPAPSNKTAEQSTPPKEAAPATPAAGAHSGGMERFKEPGVYVDGKPLGVLRFGELPVPLEPVWFEERAAVSFKPGDNKPRFRIAKQRRYRYRDYLAAIGVDVSKIKEMHIYGGNQRAAAVVIPGDSVRDNDDFLFRFGGSIWGKPLPACPSGVGDGKCPDQIGSIAVYVEKDPPVRKGGHFYFEGKKIDGIPYLGKPIRGGVRVYLDGPLTTIVKRNKLKSSGLKSTGPEGKEVYKFFDFLKSQGIDTDVVQEAWIVRYDRRVRKLTRKELLSTSFKASPVGSGEILLGDDETVTHAISLHSKPVPAEDLPVLLQEEIDKSDG